MRFAARHFRDPVIHVTRDRGAGTVTFWVDDGADSTQWASLTLTRSDMDGLAREFGVEIDDPEQGLEPTTTAPTTPGVGYAVESADDDGPDIVLGGEG